MPYHIEEREDEYCVIKDDDGEVMGCHETREEAEDQIAAIEANEGESASAETETFQESGPETKNLAMVALYPKPEEAEAIAIEGGLEVDDLHVTLVFLGEADELDADAVTEAVALVAAELESITGNVGGIGHFSEGPDGVPIILLPDVQGMTLLRERVVDELGHKGIRSPSEHGFLPHMTLIYGDSGQPLDLEHGEEKLGLPLTFDAISVVIGNERTDYELAGARVASGGAIVNPDWPLAVANVAESWLDSVRWVRGTPAPSEGHLTIFSNDRRLEDVTTTELATETEEEVESSEATRWRSEVAFENWGTDDGRFILPDALDWREPPLSLMAMVETTEGGHLGAQVAGKMESFRKEKSELGKDVKQVLSEGSFSEEEYGTMIARMVQNEELTGISVDLAVDETDWCFRDPETGELIEPDEMTEEQWEKAWFGEYEFAVKKGTILMATVCPAAAFAEAKIAVLTAAGAVQMRPGVWRHEGKFLLTLNSTIEFVRAPSLTASAAGKAPLKPPRSWFEVPEADGPTPLTVTDKGQVFGHLAVWNQCHTAFDVCTTAPRSHSEYSYFHLGEIETAEGETVAVGKITVGENAGHAPLSYDSKKTIEHYDNAGCVAAFVRAKDGRHGIWLSGAIRSDVPAEKIRDLRANPPSGDWRMEGGSLELQGILAVPVPGFPVPRSELRLVASGEVEEVAALVATGYSEHVQLSPRQRRVRMGVLQRRRQALKND